MKLSEKVNLEKSQYELDFVDIDLDTDLPLFLNPFLFRYREDDFSEKATLYISSFFQKTINLINDDKIDEAQALFRHLSEPNETHLGLSSGKPKGKGVGSKKSSKLLHSLIDSPAVKSGLVENLEDTALFIEGVGKDNISDITTNIIKKLLIEYTQEQCNLWGINLREDTPSGFYWDPDFNEWKNEMTEMLVIDGEKIILVPKSIVRTTPVYNSYQYHQHFALTFLQEDHKERDTKYVRKKYNEDGDVVRKWVTKKDLKENILSLDKNKLVKFTKKYENVFEDFKENVILQDEPFRAEDVDPASDEGEVAKYLIEKLEEISPGTEDAHKYHDLMVGVLDFIFYPLLTKPRKEEEINEGRKRIDILFMNESKTGIFNFIEEKLDLPCAYVPVECKNYNNDINNEEIDQLLGRFNARRKVGVISCRHIDKMNDCISRCRDIYQNNNALIIPLTDEDIKEMLSSIADGEHEQINEIVEEKVNSIVN